MSGKIMFCLHPGVKQNPAWLELMPDFCSIMGRASEAQEDE
jgi:hypothetical protein